MRLDKYISSTTDYSRSEARRLIKSGDVSVNDSIANNAATHIDKEVDAVYIYGEQLDKPEHRYFMLNKPLDTVCANTDNQHPTVIDLIEEPNIHLLQIAGRLDIDTTGLVLLTDNGQWNHRITSPARQCYKTYHVTLASPISEADIRQLEQGVQLHGEAQLTKPAQVVQTGDTTIELRICEGKYHQVKRMMAAINNHVTNLHRQMIGHIILDPDLAPGEYRRLTPDEINGVTQ